MRALLVGAGGMGRTWAKNLSEHGEVELAGWVDVIPGQVETASEMVGLSPMPFTNLNQAISDVKPDFIVDVTIPEAHEEVLVLQRLELFTEPGLKISIHATTFYR